MSEGSGGGAKIILFGCLAVVVVLVIAITVGYYYIKSNARSLVSGVATRVATDMIDSSELPQRDKQLIKEQLNRVKSEFDAGRLSTEQVGQIVQKLVEGPYLQLAVIAAHIEDSTLSEEQKEQASMTLHRVGQGLNEGSIEPGAVPTELVFKEGTDESGNPTFKADVSPQTLESFMAECRRLADEAGVPEEDSQFEIGSFVKRSVDEALAEADQPSSRIQPIFEGAWMPALA